MPDGDSGNNSAQFTAANSESLSITDNASLSTGDIDFSFVGWIYLDTVDAIRGILGKWQSPTELEHVITPTAAGAMRFAVSSTGADVTVLTSTFGNLSATTWYFFFCSHDSVANTLNISINNGTVDSVSYLLGVRNGTSNFVIGNIEKDSNFMNGRIDSIGFAKSVLTAATITSLYNGGAGKRWCQLTGTEQALFTSWWDLGEASGSRSDSTASANTLTDNNTVTQAAGVTSGACSSASPDKSSAVSLGTSFGTGAAGGHHGF